MVLMVFMVIAENAGRMIDGDESWPKPRTTRQGGNRSDGRSNETTVADSADVIRKPCIMKGRGIWTQKVEPQASDRRSVAGRSRLSCPHVAPRNRHETDVSVIEMVAVVS